MDFNKIKLLINTITYLRPIQIYYRLYYFLRNRLFGYNVKKKNINGFNLIVWKNRFDHENSFFEKENSFTFLNISHFFSDDIDWNFNQFGKLWTYNLNYFDYLNQKNMSKETGLQLIKEFIDNDVFLIDGKEPYPISLRGVNWVKFLSNYQVKNEVINNNLYYHYCILLNNLEYHLLGNHLLENAFSLLFGAYYFQDKKLYNKSKKILEFELNEQILNDGGHFELSPMYHQIILSRILDCILLINLNPKIYEDDLLLFLRTVAAKMCSWINEVTFENGDIPMVNDSAFNIAPNTNELLLYAKKLDIETKPIKLLDSGYRFIKKKKYELFIDAGNVGASYQPGHVHSDTLNFILYINKSPVIVDRGISTYEKNNLRQEERSTVSHNTIQIDEFEQTEVWGGFRVARRANLIELDESNGIKATHDGYSRIGCLHTRSFDLFSETILIKDIVSNSSNRKTYAYLHFHPTIKLTIINENTVMIGKGISKISFIGDGVKIKNEDYDFALGFNNVISSTKLKVTFIKNLKTIIKF